MLQKRRDTNCFWGAALEERHHTEAVFIKRIRVKSPTFWDTDTGDTVSVEERRCVWKGKTWGKGHLALFFFIFFPIALASISYTSDILCDVDVILELLHGSYEQEIDVC